MITLGNIIDIGFGLSIMLLLTLTLAEEVYDTKFKATKFLGKFFVWICAFLAILFAFGFIASIVLFIIGG